MRRPVSLIVLVLAVHLAALLAIPGVASALESSVMSPADVVEIDRARDGGRVTVEGEAVGEHLRAMGGGRWVNILGDETGLGIWVTDEMAEEITYFGDYKNDGDILRFTGTVNIACTEHGGEFDVHATSMRVIEVGAPREHEVQPIKGVIGFAGIVVAAFLWRLYGRRRDRRML